MPRSWWIANAPRLWALWAASRPSQLALVGLLYVMGVGMTTVGTPLVGSEATAEGLAGSFQTQVAAGGVALVPVAVAIHYANEYADVDTDARTERTPFSGGSGALVETGLSASFLRRALVVAGVLAIGVGLGGLVTGVLSPLAVGLLAVGFVAGIAYSLPPIALVRRGVGEPINMVLGGLVLPVYGMAVVARPTGIAVLAVVPFTLVVGCNLLAVHWPDRRADAAVGKRTLAVRWPPTRIRQLYAGFAVGAAAIAVGLWWYDVLPAVVTLAHLSPVPFLGWGWITLTRRRSPLPAVAAMVVLAATLTLAWWWAGIG